MRLRVALLFVLTFGVVGTAEAGPIGRQLKAFLKPGVSKLSKAFQKLEQKLDGKKPTPPARILLNPNGTPAMRTPVRTGGRILLNMDGTPQ
jgi:hypothetical protein